MTLTSNVTRQFVHALVEEPNIPYEYYDYVLPLIPTCILFVQALVQWIPQEVRPRKRGRSQKKRRLDWSCWYQGKASRKLVIV